MADDKTEVGSDSDHVPEENDYPKPNIRFPSCRHILAFLSFLGFINVYAMRVNLSVALVAMVNSSFIEKKNVTSECASSEANTTNVHQKSGDFEWDSNTQGLILGAFFYGYITTQVPGGYLAQQFGGKLLFGFGVLCTAVFTLLTPLAAKVGVPLLVATRILEGVGEGVTFPAMHAILSHWAPPLERSKLGTFVYAGSQLGTVLSLPISGWLCNSIGWESVFYFFGALGCLWFIIWMIFAFDKPSKHPRISDAERIYIESSIGHTEVKCPPTPWGAIFTSVPFWALLTCHVCNNWGFYTLLTCLPKYMSDVLGFDIASDGLLSALPYLVMWIMINISGQTADYLRYRKILSTTSVRKLMNCIGFGSPGFLLFLMGYLGCHRVASVATMTCAVALSGFTTPGIAVNHLDLASPFAGPCGAAIFLLATGYVGCDRTLAIVMVTLALGISAIGQAGYGINHLDIAPVFAGLGGAAVFLVVVGYVGCDATLAVVVLTLAVGISAAGQAGYNVNHLDIAPIFAGLGGVAVFLVAVGYVGCNKVVAVVLLTLAVGVSAAGMSGYQVNHIDIGPPFAGTLLGLTNAAATIPGFVGPQVVGILTKGIHSSLRHQWKIVFFISGAIYATGAIVFLLFGSGKEQAWSISAGDYRPLSQSEPVIHAQIAPDAVLQYGRHQPAERASRHQEKEEAH